jgi:hypothetical protein
MDISKIVEAVNSIETDIFESTGGVEYLNVSVSTNGFCAIVEFVGIQIWNSEQDDEPENMEILLRRLIKEEIAKINLIKL